MLIVCKPDANEARTSFYSYPVALSVICHIMIMLLLVFIYSFFFIILKDLVY